jgi:hypothetical protein
MQHECAERNRIEQHLMDVRGLATDANLSATRQGAAARAVVFAKLYTLVQEINRLLEEKRLRLNRAREAQRNPPATLPSP